MTQPKLLKEAAEALIRNHQFTFPEKVYILAIRAYYLDTMGKVGENDYGIYDDALFLITPDNFIPVNGNTDPSKQFPGVAVLVPGIHYYKKGLHHLSNPDPKKRYPAFRPASPDESVPVKRVGGNKITKGIAINIHKGSFTSTSSEGCQTVYPDQWLNFQQHGYTAMDTYIQHEIPYILIDQTI
jgi:lysozyme